MVLSIGERMFCVVLEQALADWKHEPPVNCQPFAKKH